MNQMTKFSRARLILTVDSSAALFVGLGILLLPIPFESWYSLPRSLFLFTGFVNLGYGFYSGSLVIILLLRKHLPRVFVHLLIAANSAWSLGCIGIIFANWTPIGLLGIAHFLFEGVFVFVLAVLEYYFVRLVCDLG